MFKLVVATNNAHKVKEYQEMFTGYDIKFYSMKDLNLVSDPVEDGNSYQENSLIKAKALANKTNLPVIADDSGLNVVSLNNFPGIYSSRFADSYGGNDVANLKLIEKLKPFEDKSAFFSCLITLMNVEDKPLQFEGRCEGYILDKPVGNGGFGYDPIFYSNEAKIAFGEASPEIKNKYSHRAKAVQQLIKYLKERGLI